MSSFWINMIIVFHVVVAIAIIGLVLLQHGKGADMGSGFGGGASSSLFGATGSANFLSRTTAVLAAVFFLTSLGLAYLATNRVDGGAGVMDAVKEQPAAPAPAAKEAAPDGGEPAESSAPKQDAPTTKQVPNQAIISGLQR
jgi:preprotein translocase subunit SecG